MEKEYEYLLHLLGAYLSEREPEAREGIHWPKLVQLSQIHCVTGILGYLTMQYPICPDGELNKALRKGCMETILLFTQRGAAMEALSGELSRAGIDHILMKGFELRDYYPVPELRTYGDIDFVIHPEDRQKCHELLLSQGFQVETDWEPVFSYIRGREFYEVHVDIMEVDVSEKADYRGYFQNMWSHTVPAEGRSRRFRPEYHFLYLLTHIAKHINGSGAGARMYLDVAAFVKHFRQELDWAWVETELKRLSLWEFASTVLSAVEAWFGVEPPMGVLRPTEQTLAEFTEFTMEAGVFGHHNREGALATLKQEPEDTSRLGIIVHRLFPPAEQIENRYTYLRGKHWLLPVAWIHRLVKTRGTWNDHAHEAGVILSADQREVDRQARIMRSIGL